jgi:secreted trypsin-like serine protease
LGEHSISNQTETKVEDISIEEVVVHEGYNPSTKFNDIALIRLSRKIDLLEKVIDIH